MSSDLSLTLYESVDVEDGVVRLDSSDMRMLGSLVGELVLVEGARRVYLAAQPSPVGDRNQCIAQVSPLTARNLGVQTGQKVRLAAERQKLPIAELVTLQAEDDIDQLHLLARKKQICVFWNKRVVCVEDTLRLPTLDRSPLHARVTGVQPQGAVQIGRATEFVIEAHKVDSKLIRLGGLRETYRVCQSLMQARFVKGLSSAAHSVMLSGPAGCGKSCLVSRLAQDFNLELHVLDAYQLLDKALSPAGLDLSALMTETARRGRGLLLLDHLEVLLETEGQAPALAVASYTVLGQICSLLDEVPTQPNVMVVGVVSGEFNARFRAHQRFDVHIPVDAPNRWGRHEVLLLAAENASLVEDCDLEAIADLARGMTASNLTQMIKRAQMLSGGLRLSNNDLMRAFRSAEAFAASEVHCDIPKTSWDEVAGLDDVKRLMHETMSWTLFQYDKFALAGVRPPQSILLSGGQGTGKTSFVRALAGHIPLHFIEVACPALAARSPDDALRYLRECFALARRKAPCLLFFDDIDVLFDLACASAGDASACPHPLIGQLTSELDSLSSLLGVVVIAATNRPDRLTADMLRPGRFDFVVTLLLPDAAARKKILQIHARKLPLAADVDFDRLAANTQGMSPADIAGLCNRVGLMALRHSLNAPELTGFLPVVTADLFDIALRGRKS